MVKRIVFAAGAALTGVLVLALLNVNLLIQRNREYLLGRAEQAFGRKVSLDQIEVTLWPVGIRLVNFAVADDPTFSAGDLLRAKDVRVDFQVLPLIIGQFRPEKVTMESPRLTLMRDATGRYNFARTAHEKNHPKRADGGKKPSNEIRNGQLAWIPALKISDGALHYRDLQSGGDLLVSRINLKSSDFEPDRPFEFQLEAAVMGAQSNFKFKSQIGPTAGHEDYRDIPVDGEINAHELDLGKVNKALPQFRKSVPRALRFDGVYTIRELTFKGTLNNLSLKGAVTGTDASFRFD